MKSLVKLTAGAFAAIVMISGAQAQGIYMKTMPAIKGDVTQPGFEGQIELYSFSFGLGNDTMSAAGRTTRGVCTFEPLQAVKAIDMATADLIQLAALGKQLDEAVITVTRAGGEKGPVPVIILTLRNTVITHYNTGGAGGDSVSESLALDYTDVRGEVVTVDDRGSQTKEPFNIMCF